ncbi:MAG: bifunctional diguanylate cyclase/phosphodiesterase [Cyanobacteria bacterium J06650_10]
MESSLLNQIFSALNILALELTADHKLQAIGKIPDWINQEFEHLHLETAAFEAEQMSSFLSNFLIDAAAFWSQVSASLSPDEISSQTLRSGVWTETGRSGKDIHLEAIALQLDDHKIILIESSGLVTSEKIKLLQTVREEQLNFESRQKETAETIFHATFYDTLTGLPNRNLFASELETFFEESQWKRDRFFAVVVINIDRFQSLNNSLGTKAGDQVLITVANRICDCLRKPDIPVRFGADEFGILLSHVDAERDVTSIVSRILETISRPFLIDGHKTSFTASAGIALSEDWYQNSRDLLRDANLALQRAKSLGRGHYQIFDREMRTQAFELWNLESALRAAIEREQLQLCYQPIIELSTQRIQRFEALIRWEHPTQGWISPSRFIPLAEESGLIVDLDSWVFKTACETIHHWQTITGHIAQINVNVSARHFTEGNLLASMRKAMLPAHIPPNSLCLEITESSLLADPKSVVQTLNQLKSLGIDIAIDDFGTGYASLSYLQDLPLDVLKIDGYFIKMMDHSSSEIVKTIISLGHKLGLSVTAEQVETLSQYRELRKLGCDTVQGYLLSKPVPIVDAQNLLNAEVIVSR